MQGNDDQSSGNKNKGFAARDKQGREEMARKGGRASRKKSSEENQSSDSWGSYDDSELAENE